MRFLMRSRQSTGFTLIEVMAGLAILGSVLVAVVLARGALSRSVGCRATQIGSGARGGFIADAMVGGC